MKSDQIKVKQSFAFVSINSFMKPFFFLKSKSSFTYMLTLKQYSFLKVKVFRASLLNDRVLEGHTTINNELIKKVDVMKIDLQSHDVHVV